MNEALTLPAFGGCGIELEYMIVDRETLAVRPIADELIRAETGTYSNDAERGDFGWSNELALHLLEIKNSEPRLALEGLPDRFLDEIRRVNELLAAMGARLLPTGMHPWMIPRQETRLWPHRYTEIYRGYDRIFDCRRHGWANLQSMHVNLPFADDDEFARLHAACRLVLPLLPALAASSPIADGEATGFMDFRMECYWTHADRLSSMMGAVIPEPVSSEAEYRTLVLEPMYREIAPLDPEGVMQDEWLNARAAIARFDRHAIELRVIDTQETPRADLAIAAATAAVVRACYDGVLAPGECEQPMPTAFLAALLRACARHAEETLIDEARYLGRLRYPGNRCSARELWQHLLELTLYRQPQQRACWQQALDLILSKGTLARRILRAVGSECSRARLRCVYRSLADCLVEDRLFAGLD